MPNLRLTATSSVGIWNADLVIFAMSLMTTLSGCVEIYSTIDSA